MLARVLEANALFYRQLQIAVREEDFIQAADLRDHLNLIRDGMPPIQQFLAHKLQQLDFGTCTEQEEALKAIGRSLRFPQA